MKEKNQVVSNKMLSEESLVNSTNSEQYKLGIYAS